MQLAQQRSSAALAWRFLILELDRSRRTTDGRNFLDSALTTEHLATVGLKLFLNDSLLIESTSLEGTIDRIDRTASYIESDGADRLSRPKPDSGPWGTRSNRDWGIHILQSFPGIGPRHAGLIYDRTVSRLSGRLDRIRLTSIPGIGKVIARRLLETLRRSQRRVKYRYPDHGLRRCDEPECEIYYQWQAETAEQCEAFSKRSCKPTSGSGILVDLATLTHLPSASVAFVSAQVAVAGTAVPLWQPPGGTQVGAEPVLTKTAGTIQDPVPIVVTFSVAVFIGPTGVSSSTGVLWPANTPLSLAVVGTSDQLFAIDDGSSGTAYVLVGRQ